MMDGRRMPSSRMVTTLAIALGGSLGALAAYVGNRAPELAAEPEPPAATAAAREEPTAAEQGSPIPAPPRPSPRPETISAAAAAPPPAPAPTEAPQVTTVSFPELESQAAVDEAELACARGDGRACLAAAQAFKSGGPIPIDLQRARMLTGLGVQKLASDCVARIPLGCLELAKLHAAGHGVTRDRAAADALVDRATMLCRARPDLSGCPGEAR
jgi:TPR repeat protein